MRKERCIKCDHEWFSRVENPKECPHCKTRDWKLKHKRVDQEDAF